MSIVMLTAFNPANNRTTVSSGEEFEVDLSVMALPVTDPAADTIVFTSSVASCTVSPPSIDVSIDANDNRVTKHFRMSIRSSSMQTTEITARASGSGSADSFVIRVIP